MRATRSRWTSRFRPRPERLVAAALLAVTTSFGGPADAADPRVVAALDRDAALLLAQAQAGTAPSDVVTLEAFVNGTRSGNVYVYAGAQGPEIEESAVRRWRIVVPAGAGREVDGRRYVPVAALAGATAEVEMRTQRLLLTVPAAMFEPNSILLGPSGGTGAFATTVVGVRKL